MRGKGKCKRGIRETIRITPAYAGKSKKATQYIGMKQDHPRLCGEKLNSGNKCKFQSGSPPPMRGKVSVISKRRTKLRITPAYAGKRSVSVRKFHGSWDHPRLCGEKPPVGVPDSKITGSPPPMRGKEFICLYQHKTIGITPAYAGKRVEAVQQNANLQGSPPPMRGKD